MESFSLRPVSLQFLAYKNITNHLKKTLLTHTPQKLDPIAPPPQIQQYFTKFLPKILKDILTKFKDSRNELFLCSILDFLTALCHHDVLIVSLLDSTSAEQIFSSLKLILMSKSTKLQKKSVNMLLLLIKCFKNNFGPKEMKDATSQKYQSIKSLPFSIVHSDLDYFLLQTFYAQDMETTNKLIEIFLTLLNTKVLSQDRIEKLMEFSLRGTLFTITHKDLDRETYLKLLKSSIYNIKRLSYTIQSKLVTLIRNLISSVTIPLSLKLGFSELIFHCKDLKLKEMITLTLFGLIHTFMKSKSNGIIELKVFHKFLQIDSPDSKYKIMQALTMDENLIIVKNITRYMNYRPWIHSNPKRTLLSYGIMTELLKMETIFGSKLTPSVARFKWKLRYFLSLLDCSSTDLKYLEFIRILIRNKFNSRFLEIHELKNENTSQFLTCVEELTYKLLNLLIPTSTDLNNLSEILSTLMEIIKFIHHNINDSERRESLLKSVLLGSSAHFSLDFLLTYAVDIKDQKCLILIVQFMGDWIGSIKKIQEAKGIRGRALRNFVPISKRLKIFRHRLFLYTLSLPMTHEFGFDNRQLSLMRN